MGFKFQFVTLAGFHALNLQHVQTRARLSQFEDGLRIPNCRKRSSRPRSTATPRPNINTRVGTGYFDDVARVIAGGESSTAALQGSTEEEQFH
jgi:isocitrate lyase